MIVIHGESWPGGVARELVALDGYLAARDYLVIGMNNRLEGYAEFDQHSHVQDLLTRMLKLVDSNGFRYTAKTALPRGSHMTGLFIPRIGSTEPREWVVVFQVWEAGLGYSLRVQHPDPGPEAMRAAVVPLQI